MFGQPGGPHDRTQPAKLEIPFGHAFDKGGISLPNSAVACAPSVCGQPSRAVPHSGRVAKTSWACLLANQTLPSFKTIVGVIAESGRLRGAIALFSL